MYLSCAPHFQPEKTQQPDSQAWLNTNPPERAESFGKSEGGRGVSCSLVFHFSLFGFVSAPMLQSACLSYRRAACSQPVSLQPPPTNCSQPVCHRKLHFHLQATHEQTRPASTWRPKTGRGRVGDGCGQTRKPGDWFTSGNNIDHRQPHEIERSTKKKTDVNLVLPYICSDWAKLDFI